MPPDPLSEIYPSLHRSLFCSNFQFQKQPTSLDLSVPPFETKNHDENGKSLSCLVCVAFPKWNITRDLEHMGMWSSQTLGSKEVCRFSSYIYIFRSGIERLSNGNPSLIRACTLFLTRQIGTEPTFLCQKVSEQTWMRSNSTYTSHTQSQKRTHEIKWRKKRREECRKCEDTFQCPPLFWSSLDSPLCLIMVQIQKIIAQAQI